MTKFKPILFSTPMVEAINENRKSQTRRVIKHHCEIDSIKPVVRCLENEKDRGKFILTDINGEDFLINPYAFVGDVLWVRETFHSIHDSESDQFLRFGYRADGDYKGAKWKPNIFMPKEACRFFLKVKAIRVERLQDISEDNAIAEGIEILGYDEGTIYRDYLRDHSETNNSIVSFSTLWQSINGLHSWSSNPFVWVIEFERIEKPNNFI